MSAQSLRVLAGASFARLDRGAAALATGGASDPVETVAASLEGESLPAEGMALAVALQAAAVRFDEAGRRDDAALVFGFLAGLDEGRAEGLLGLAVLAVREGRMDEAFALCSGLLADAGPDARPHPRLLSLLGVCELERGNGTQAQAHLAAAARLARRDANLRAEMQVAQRALLLMHLHS